MLNKLHGFIRRYDMIQPGDTVICAVSGGADSMAMLFAMYLLAPRLNFTVEAAHFNHHLRAEESVRDEAFVRDFCDAYQIPFHIGSGDVTAGPKGLEAAAREARYGFLRSLPGKVATAHTANDNAETVLMHMVRGTGLKGLGGIMPVNGSVIRPMLSITRGEVLAFLQEYHVPCVQDSSNDTDQFLRNRLRREVMPLLEKENPKLAENLSAMALRLRSDEAALSEFANAHKDYSVTQLQQMPPALRSRALASFLERSGVREPEAEHIALAESLVNSHRPSAKASFPGDVTVCRNYDRLEVRTQQAPVPLTILPCPGSVCVCDVKITASKQQPACAQKDCFTVCPQGQIVVRSRQAGDTIRLPGGTKLLKKLFIDSKIPEAMRLQIPVVADDVGVLGVYGFGPNLDRLIECGTGVQISFIK